VTFSFIHFVPDAQRSTTNLKHPGPAGGPEGIDGVKNELNYRPKKPGSRAGISSHPNSEDGGFTIPHAASSGCSSAGTGVEHVFFVIHARSI
jgi:hypothetical protein